MKLKINESQIKILQAISETPMSAADIRFNTGITPVRFAPQIRALINLYLVKSIDGKYVITQKGKDAIFFEEKRIIYKGLFK